MNSRSHWHPPFPGENYLTGVMKALAGAAFMTAGQRAWAASCSSCCSPGKVCDPGVVCCTPGQTGNKGILRNKHPTGLLRPYGLPEAAGLRQRPRPGIAFLDTLKTTCAE